MQEIDYPEWEQDEDYSGARLEDWCDDRARNINDLGQFEDDLGLSKKGYLLRDVDEIYHYLTP